MLLLPPSWPRATLDVGGRPRVGRRERIALLAAPALKGSGGEGAAEVPHRSSRQPQPGESGTQPKASWLGGWGKKRAEAHTAADAVRVWSHWPPQRRSAGQPSRATCPLLAAPARALHPLTPPLAPAQPGASAAVKGEAAQAGRGERGGSGSARRPPSAPDSWLADTPSTPLWRSNDPFSSWKRPAWLPSWLDPGDPGSDLRLWIWPFLLAPYLAVQTLKLSLLGPLLEHELHRPGTALFHLRAEQQERVEVEAERFRLHLDFEQLMKRAPPLSTPELLDKVRDKLAADESELMEANCVSMTELLTDSTYTAVVVVNVLVNLSSVKRIQVQVGREFFAMDSSRQAFLLLLVSDILVGYHSSEGWATLLEVIANHYGFNERKDLTALFIAVVPVSFDVVFKYWCYSSLRNWSPDTQIILDEIDH